MFKVVGISTHNHMTKVRFANDLVARYKILSKGGHTNIELLELPTPMTKPDAVKFLTETKHAANPLYSEAIELADEKYNKDPQTRLASKSLGISLESLQARAAKKAESA